MSRIKKEYQNRQKGLECTMVAILNAAIHYRIPVPDIDEEEYTALQELCGAMYGTVINIQPILEIYHLVVEKIPEDLNLLLEKVAQGVPVMVGIYHPDLGHHSCVVVNSRAGNIHVPNFLEGTDERGWIEVSDFKRFLVHGRKNLFPLRSSYWVIKERTL